MAGEFRHLELYSGIGGFRCALSGVLSNVVSIAIDNNEKANETYHYNFNDVVPKRINIEHLTKDDIEKMELDLLTLSPPCQPYTRFGKQLGVSDNRSNSLHHVISLLSELDSKCLPGYILLENVVGFENSECCKAFIEMLLYRKYLFQIFILTPTQINIPNTRNRVYILAKREQHHKQTSLHFPLPVECQSMDLKWSQTLEWKQREQFLYRCVPIHVHMNKTTVTIGETLFLPHTGCTEIQVGIANEQIELPLQLWQQKFADYRFSIAALDSQNSECFTQHYGVHLKGTGSYFFCGESKLLRSSLKRTEPLMSANELPLVYAKGKELSQLCGQIRFFSPREMLCLMGFPTTYKLPPTLGTRSCYKLIGNSVNVSICKILLKHLLS
ncbi:hypothetical protein RFI_05537 [Reticulomyxa filosa]|uniref:DNA (cytosine-5-)-methyltransferase n=1 Tax=Reticulomyxa filosa TaxID=46433 RepID=X6NZ50_RETFI|nr:hypothetical protein RFI_05537 [Reticulomyxa filosa]|eukprot:ETO31585.1 hypothetical protein RFI_05537 [Reticulomyxa filosa]